MWGLDMWKKHCMTLCKVRVRSSCCPTESLDQDSRNNDPNNALAVHISKMHHSIKWEDVKVITREEQWTKRKIKEGLAMGIYCHNNIS